MRPVETTLNATSQAQQELVRQIKRLLPSDEHFKEVKDSLSNEENSQYEFKDNLLFYQGKLYLPANESLRLQVLRQAHDSPLAGHPGRDKTLSNLNRFFYWPGMSTSAESYVKTCDLCQRSKSPRHKTFGLLQPLPIPDGIWQSISMDHIVCLPESQGFDSILVVVDRRSKMAHFIPAKAVDDSKTLISQSWTHVFSKHGLPSDIVSDRGTLFTSNFFKETLKQAKIKSNLSTSYHPQTDGETERVNQILEQYLRSYCNFQQNDWSSLLPLDEFC